MQSCYTVPFKKDVISVSLRLSVSVADDKGHISSCVMTEILPENKQEQRPEEMYQRFK